MGLCVEVAKSSYSQQSAFVRRYKLCCQFWLSAKTDPSFLASAETVCDLLLPSKTSLCNFASWQESWQEAGHANSLGRKHEIARLVNVRRLGENLCSAL